MKNSIHIKFFILSILIIIPISILYLNLGDELFNNTKENLKNNNGDYINICNSSKANYYNLSPSSLEPYKSQSLKTDISSCKFACSNDKDCDLYLTQNDVCKMYNLQTGFDEINVNCNNNPLPSQSGHNYLGEGKVDRNFYNKNKDKFVHIDYLLDTANDIKGEYIKINGELTNLQGTSDKRNNLKHMYKTVNGKLDNLANFLDLSRNSLYSNFVDSKYAMKENDKIKLNGNELSYVGMLKEFNKLYDESNDLEGRMNNDNLEYNRKYLVYTILSILMVISVIIFIVYKVSPHLISDSIIISYFIGVLLLVFFIHNYFKI